MGTIKLNLWWKTQLLLFLGLIFSCIYLSNSLDSSYLSSVYLKDLINWLGNGKLNERNLNSITKYFDWKE